MRERMKVLITVKAAPEPSKSYGDTVCVAGVRVDREPHEWIRLYPVPFRHLATEEQFSKYQVVELDVNPAQHDSRSESRRPVWGSLTIDEAALKVPARAIVLEPMQTRTMCELVAGVQANMNAQSLGLVRVRELQRFEITDHPGWTPAQQASIAASLEPTLFDDPDAKPVPALEAPRLRVYYKYLCMSEGCGGHRQSILDFEMSALQYRGRHLALEELKARITTKFRDEKFGPDKRTSLFVGNIADPVKRRSFSTLGVFTVPAGSDYSSTLF